jgi:hypothetical protein
MGALCGGFVLLKLSPQKTDRDRDICSFVSTNKAGTVNPGGLC